MSAAPSLPPLLRGLQVAGEDPFAAACRAARDGCEGGLVLFDPAPERLRAAVVFAPEVPLAEAMVMLPLAGVALQNALGALGPSEMAVQLGWTGGIFVNGGICGHLRAAAATRDPDAVPDWLVIGLSLQMWLDGEGGHAPDRTALAEEGFGVDATGLLESWARHLLAWVHTWEDEGTARLHRDWSALATGLGGEMRRDGVTGTFLGLDERLGLLVKGDAGTTLVPLVDLLEEAP